MLKYIILVLVFSSIIFIARCVKETSPILKSEFEIVLNNEKYTVPAEVKIINKSIGASQYLWNFEGSEIDSSKDTSPPLIKYNKQGTFKITLRVSNKFNESAVSEKTFTLDDSIILTIKLINQKSMHTPVSYVIQNHTRGARQHKWFFENGTPSTSTEYNPVVEFNKPGKHKISYTASNNVLTYQFDTTITVLDDIVNAFTLNWSKIDNDKEVPFTFFTNNQSKNAFEYLWTINSSVLASPIFSQEKDFNYTFTLPGEYYMISLSTKNDKTTIVSQEKITLFSNTNIYHLKDLKFGILNSSQKQQGNFFSTKRQEVILPDSIFVAEKDSIEFGFYTFNESFETSYFFSPDITQNLYAHIKFSNPQVTSIINRADLCNCSLYGIKTDFFDAMTNDVNLKQLEIPQVNFTNTINFNNTSLPYLIFFKTFDNRKGIIKVKQIVKNGLNSYLIVDLKIMKKP